MDGIRKLEIEIGGRWHGISFLNNSNDLAREVEWLQVPRFCEAVKLAVVKKMVIKPGDFTCPGALYAFGGMVDLKETMIDRIAELKGCRPEHAVHLLDSTPHFQKAPDYIGFNCTDEPDIAISQLQPEQAMRLMQLYNARLGKNLQTEISSIISACGNTAVRTYQTQDMAMSFGCDDSRAFGTLTRDRLYVGLPYSLVEELLQ
jgi:uncharacterized protein (DUF169 family)